MEPSAKYGDFDLGNFDERDTYTFNSTYFIYELSHYFECVTEF